MSKDPVTIGGGPGRCGKRTARQPANSVSERAIIPAHSRFWNLHIAGVIGDKEPQGQVPETSQRGVDKALPLAGSEWEVPPHCIAHCHLCLCGFGHLSPPTPAVMQCMACEALGSIPGPCFLLREAICSPTCWEAGGQARSQSCPFIHRRYAAPCCQTPYSLIFHFVLSGCRVRQYIMRWKGGSLGREKEM